MGRPLYLNSKVLHMFSICLLSGVNQYFPLIFQDKDNYKEWKSNNFPTFLEVLAEFPSTRLPAEFILSQLPLIQPRLYRYHAFSTLPLSYEIAMIQNESYTHLDCIILYPSEYNPGNCFLYQMYQ